jgi:hypothetical protein
MVKACKFALILLGSLSLPVSAQNSPPDCMANYDRDRDIFTVLNPMPGEITQQCLLTVLPGSRSLYHAMRLSRPAPQFTEGTYAITLQGGGSGLTQEGIAGGASGAAPLVTNLYLAAGTYRLTLGTGGGTNGACVANDDVTCGSGARAGHGFISIRPL